MTCNLIIEISMGGDCSVCAADGSSASGSEYVDDLRDCTKPGDAQEACEYVLDQIGVDFCIVARTDGGGYVNRGATDAEKEACCKAIFFESETDFSDPRTADAYLVWEAACTMESDQ